MGTLLPFRKWVDFQEKFEACLESREVEECLRSLAQEIENYVLKKPEDTESILILAQVYFKLQEIGKAIQILESLVPSNSDIRLKLMLVDLYIEKLDIKNAWEVICSLKDANLPVEWKDKIRAYEVLILFNFKDVEMIEKIGEELKKEDKDLEELLFSNLPYDTALTIIQFYKAYKQGLELLEQKVWLRTILSRIKETFSPEKIFVLAYADYEYPEWITPVIYVFFNISYDRDEDLLKWEVKKESEIFEFVEEFVEEPLMVEVKGVINGSPSCRV